MSIDRLLRFLLWCTVINYAVILIWFLFFIVAHDSIYLLHSAWFRISVQQFDMLHYGGMAIFKIGILLFNLVPYIALRLSQKNGAA
jgi:hypothetical protein